MSESLCRQRINAAVSRAIKLGVIKREGCCRKGCNREYTVAHHKDYNKPLSVVFLCMKHHVAWHSKRAAKQPKEKLYNLSASSLFDLGMKQLGLM